MWQLVAIKLVDPKGLTAKICGHFCLCLGSAAATGDGCSPKSTWLCRPRHQKSKPSVYFFLFVCCCSFLMVLQSNTTSIMPAPAVAPVVAGSVLLSWNAVQGCDPGAGSWQKCLSVLWRVVEGRRKVWGCRSKGISSRMGAPTFFKVLGSGTEGLHLPFPCLFQLHRSRRAFSPLFFPVCILFFFSCVPVSQVSDLLHD